MQSRKGWFEEAKAGKLIDFGDISKFTPAEMNYVVLANLIMKNATNHYKDNSDFEISFSEEGQDTKLDSLSEEMIHQYCPDSGSSEALKTAIETAIADVKIYVSQLDLFNTHKDEYERGNNWIAFPYALNGGTVVLVQEIEANMKYKNCSISSVAFRVFVSAESYEYKQINDNEYTYISLEDKSQKYTFNSYMQLQYQTDYRYPRNSWGKFEGDSLTLCSRSELKTLYSLDSGYLHLSDIAALRLKYEDFPQIAKLVFSAEEAGLLQEAQLPNVNHIVLQDCTSLKEWEVKKLNDVLCKFKNLQTLELEMASLDELAHTRNCI